MNGAESDQGRRGGNDPMTTGSIISGTFRSEDLVPAFVQALSARLEETTFGPGADRTILVQTHANSQETLGYIERRMEQPDYFDRKDCQYDLEWLNDALDAYAPHGHFFGSHPGDGADFGFWPLALMED